ncbi:sporulation membrane protein YtaF [Paenibacillus prosopidis]|uniref:Putative sporulation protein YtaF n=1 Tax=Paenibacillus prosopidis TaxID=630520 RepID=A0A368VSK1_9BACL|nr:sporulation membrane protein YtaF [Paenibacillus prosopidis]RCW43447.1 putative sporulation protein YtaF [Paenibacillus prosopidis]
MFAHVASLLVLAFAVSLDGFGVGVTYGLRRIRIPFLSVFIIACCSGFIIWLSMQLGDWLTGFLSEFAARLIGASVLIVIGGWAIVQLKHGKTNDETNERTDAVRDERADESTSEVKPHIGELSSTALIVMVELKRLGLVIQILRTPQAADVDKSGTISASEAVMLGVALSLDAFGAGLGAAMIGLPALMTSLTIAAASALFLMGGIHFGFRFSAWKGMQTLSLLPGILLIMMGIMKLL